MSKIIIRPATREDIDAFSDMRNKPTLKAWVGLLGDTIMALGGLALVKGRWLAFLDITPEGRELLARNMYVRAALMRGAVTCLREAKALGIRFIYAEADRRWPRAEELLEKLGFHVDPRSGHVYRWTGH